MKKATSTDEAEKNEPDLDIPAEIERRQARLAAIEAAKASLEERQRQADTQRGRSDGDQRRPKDKDGNPKKSGKSYERDFGVPPAKAQDSFTDPETRIMKRAGGGFDYSYNAQTAVDETAHIIVAAEVVNTSSDVQQIPMVLAAVKAHTESLASPRTPVALLGGGHVGRSVVQVLARLPMALTWIDSRDEIFPTDLPANVRCEHSHPVHAAVADVHPGTRVLILSFSHAQDLDVVAACLAWQRTHGDLPYVNLIGSKTKWASFRQRLVARGFSEAELAHITCPIGVPGIAGKEPDVIAVAVAAHLLMQPGTTDYIC